jgi:hypothetical protein
MCRTDEDLHQTKKKPLKNTTLFAKFLANQQISAEDGKLPKDTLHLEFITEGSRSTNHSHFFEAATLLNSSTAN